MTIRNPLELPGGMASAYLTPFVALEEETVRRRDPFQTRRASLTRTYGSQSMSDPLRTVLVRRPDAAFGAADPKPWGYAAKPDLAAARREHDPLADPLKPTRGGGRFH